MTLTKKTELVLEVLRGTEIQVLARAERLRPRTLRRWVEEFLRGGVGALWEADPKAAGPLAPVIPLFPDLDAGSRSLPRGRR